MWAIIVSGESQGLLDHVSILKLSDFDNLVTEFSLANHDSTECTLRIVKSQLRSQYVLVQVCATKLLVAIIAAHSLSEKSRRICNNIAT